MKFVAHPGVAGASDQDRLLALLHLPPIASHFSLAMTWVAVGRCMRIRNWLKGEYRQKSAMVRSASRKPFVLGLRIHRLRQPLKVLFQAGANVGNLVHPPMLPAPRTRRSAIAHRPGAAAGKPGLGR